jgi:hypothetical protein
MPSTCAFLLDNNRPCRAPALHNDRYCRHHTPDALARRRAAHLDSDDAPNPDLTPSVAAPDENTPIPPAYLRAYWRTHHRVIAHADAETSTEIFDMILLALAERAISPRSAGRLLLAVLDRRKVLADEAQEAAFRALEENVRQHRAAHSAPAGTQPHSAPAAQLPDLPDGYADMDSQSLLQALTNVVYPSGAPQDPAHPFGASEIYPDR